MKSKQNSKSSLIKLKTSIKIKKNEKWKIFLLMTIITIKLWDDQIYNQSKDFPKW